MPGSTQNYLRLVAIDLDRKPQIQLTIVVEIDNEEPFGPYPDW